MKKVKVSLKASSNGKKLYLFPSAESLYVWLTHVEKGETLQVPGIEEVLIEPGGFVEAELRGFEYIYEDANRFRRIDLVRLGHAQQPKNASGLFVTVHVGWVAGGLLPMKSYSDSDIEVRRIEESESKIDLASLFNDDGDEEDVAIDLDDDEDTGDPPPDDEDE